MRVGLIGKHICETASIIDIEAEDIMHDNDAHTRRSQATIWNWVSTGLVWQLDLFSAAMVSKGRDC